MRVVVVMFGPYLWTFGGRRGQVGPVWPHSDNHTITMYLPKWGFGVIIWDIGDKNE